MKATLPTILMILASCGHRGGTPPSNSDALQVQVDRIIGLVERCEGYYSRPKCDLGDGMTIAAAMSLRDPETAKSYVHNSIAPDGRPFRSPSHLTRAQQGDQADNVTYLSFSRDHVISLLFYTVYTRDVSPLKRVWSYATSHGLKVCPGTVSQCGLTPNVLDAIGDVLVYLGESRPAVAYIPDAVTSIVQEISSASVGSWQLTLIAELALLKNLTGNNKDMWVDVAERVWRRQPENLFYRFVYVAAEGGDAADMSGISSDLTGLMQRFVVQGKSWFWNNMRVEDATGYDLIYLADLVRRGI